MDAIQQNNIPDSEYLEHPVNETATPASITKDSPNRKNHYLIIAALLIGVLCVGSCAAVFSKVMYRLLTEWPQVESVIDVFMRTMADQDAEEAYRFFSTRSKKSFQRTDLEEFLKGYNYVLFDGYLDVTITNLQMNTTSNPNSDLPQGTVANVEGTMAYKEGYTGSFAAVLEKEGGEWRIYTINIVVPPEKIGRNP